MNLEMLEKARTRVPSIPVLVNLVSQRTRQLNRGERPFLRPLSKFEDKSDIALREIAEGLVVAQPRSHHRQTWRSTARPLTIIPSLRSLRPVSSLSAPR